MPHMIVPAIVSSLIEVIITHPIDVYKTHLQLGKPTHFNTIYNGFMQRATGNIPSRTIFLISSDYMKSLHINQYIIPTLSGFVQTLVDTPVENMKIRAINLHKNISYYRGFIPHSGRNIIFMNAVLYMKDTYGTQYGGLGGALGSYISHPLDTIKTKMQSYNDYKNLTIKQLYRGSHARALMAFINMNISLTCYDYFKQLC